LQLLSGRCFNYITIRSAIAIRRSDFYEKGKRVVAPAQSIFVRAILKRVGYQFGNYLPKTCQLLAKLMILVAKLQFLLVKPMVLVAKLIVLVAKLRKSLDKIGLEQYNTDNLSRRLPTDA